MPAHKHPRKKRGKRWIADVKTSAIDVPEGTMTKSADEIAHVLLAHNKGKPPGSINRYMQFYINRAGRGLSRERRVVLKKAMDAIGTSS